MNRSSRWDLERPWLIVALVLGAATAGCAPLDPPPRRTGEQAFDEIHIAPYTSTLASAHTVQRLPSSAYKRQWFWLARPRPPVPVPPQDKIHPLLRQWMATRPGSDVVRLMVTYADTFHITRFPNPDVRLGHGDPANSGKVDTAGIFVTRLATARAPQYVADTTGLAAGTGARVVQNYWLVQATLVEMPLSGVDSLSRRKSVRYIRPNEGSKPPQSRGDGRDVNDPKAARARIGSDHYLNMGVGYGWMALLDTGIRTTHWLLSGPAARLCVVDCLTGPCDSPYELLCPGTTTPLPGDHATEGHGTTSAAILTGNDRFGEEFRGVTEVWLDGFRVYGSNRKLDPDATLRAFELAVSRLNQVIVAEMQEHTARYADVALAAEKAYQAGAAIIGANGNNDNFVAGYPAQGRNVIGVGSFDLETGNESVGEAWGLTPDLRAKPDLLGPTSTESAGNERAGLIPADESLHYLGSTSGATPYIAGAANLIRNWMNISSSTGVDPGQVYSHLILSGDRVGPFVIPPPEEHPEDPHTAASPFGAGRMRLPSSGSSRWGKTWVSANLQWVDIPIPVPDNTTVRLDVATWWPGLPEDVPNNVDITLLGPGGQEVKGRSVAGVFERVSIQNATGLAGEWRIRILPTSVGAASQVVYWGAALREDLVVP